MSAASQDDMNIPSPSRGEERDSMRDVLRAAISDAVTISEAAQILGVTTRTVQRRIDSGEIKTIEVDGTRFVCLSTPDSAPTDSAPVAQTAPMQTPPAPIAVAPIAQTAPVAPPQPAPISAPVPISAAAPAVAPTNSFADDMAARYVSQLERENTFLRSQIEAHARAEAELRTALREAMRAMPKALNEGGERPIASASYPIPAETETPLPPRVQAVVAPAPVAAVAPEEKASMEEAPPVVQTTSTLAPVETVSVPVAAPPAEPKLETKVVEVESAKPEIIQAEVVKPEAARLEAPVTETSKVETPKVAEPSAAAAAPAAASPPAPSPPFQSTPVSTPVEPKVETPVAAVIAAPPAPAPEFVEKPKAVPAPVAQSAPVPVIEVAAEEVEDVKPIKIVTPPLSQNQENSKGSYKSVYEHRRTSRPFWKAFLNMR